MSSMTDEQEKMLKEALRVSMETQYLLQQALQYIPKKQSAVQKGARDKWINSMRDKVNKPKYKTKFTKDYWASQRK